MNPFDVNNNIHQIFFICRYYSKSCTIFKANKECVRYPLISIWALPTCPTSLFSLHNMCELSSQITDEPMNLLRKIISRPSHETVIWYTILNRLYYDKVWEGVFCNPLSWPWKYLFWLRNALYQRMSFYSSIIVFLLFSHKISDYRNYCLILRIFENIFVHFSRMIL